MAPEPRRPVCCAEVVPGTDGGMLLLSLCLQAGLSSEVVLETCSLTKDLRCLIFLSVHMYNFLSIFLLVKADKLKC